MRKVVLIGSGGSGKSTLSRQLGEKLKIRSSTVFRKSPMTFVSSYAIQSVEAKDFV